MAIHSISLCTFFPITVKKWRQRRSTVNLSSWTNFPLITHLHFPLATSYWCQSIKQFSSFYSYETKMENDVIVKCPDVQSNILSCALRRFLFFFGIVLNHGVVKNRSFWKQKIFSIFVQLDEIPISSSL